jgi:hypothetical protein
VPLSLALVHELHGMLLDDDSASWELSSQGCELLYPQPQWELLWLLPLQAPASQQLLASQLAEVKLSRVITNYSTHESTAAAVAGVDQPAPACQPAG